MQTAETTNQSLFSSGLELAGLIESSDVLLQAWNAIYNIHAQTHPVDPTRPVSVKYNIYKYPSNITILAFASSPTYSTAEDVLGGDSEQEVIGSLSIFNFIGTKVNPSASIHKLAVNLFNSIENELSSLKQQLGDTSTLIITGHSLGGSVASLFTLWLLNSMSLKDTKPPLCITFGSPLLGDNRLQRAIAERPLWNACFLNVVSNQDHIPRLFTSSENPLSNATSSQNSGYKPFGTFLIYSDTGCTCFEDSEAILDVLRALEVVNDRNQDPSRFSRVIDYGSILDPLKNNTIRKGASRPRNPVSRRPRFRNNSVVDPLQAEIILQLEAAGIKNIQQQETTAMRSLISLLKERQDQVLKRKKNKFDPNKKLNEMKIHMTYLEWYKKATMDRGGYYDSYKNKDLGSREEVKSRGEIVTRQRKLTQYWKRMISEVEKFPPQEVVFFRTRWFFSGTNYRRMIEPLDIADYYMRGKRDYVHRERSQHYVLLQQWLNDDNSGGNSKERNQACSLTEDSCFWAYVEEAIISCEILKDDLSSLDDRTSAEDNLKIFEHYVMNEIDLYAVSSEIFHPKSSFMRWWNEYSNMKGPSYNSELSDFMKNHRHEYK
ncbi:hypothetical protein Leryth_007771 [Lithospermum erythrorhizon]|nr:hypothetical protein Leryth_007771 [Lithospermum erythrorhizon]